MASNHMFCSSLAAGGGGGVGLMNDYESAAEARLGSGKDPALFARGRDNFNSYHMSTLGRTGSGRAPPGLIKEPVSIAI